MPIDRPTWPTIVVTGMGVVTSLGTGKQDNWRRLIAGESGIHHITRFSTEGLRTTIAGTVDHLPGHFNSVALTEELGRLAAQEAIEQAVGLDATDAIAFHRVSRSAVPRCAADRIRLGDPCAFRPPRRQSRPR